MMQELTTPVGLRVCVTAQQSNADARSRRETQPFRLRPLTFLTRLERPREREKSKMSQNFMFAHGRAAPLMARAGFLPGVFHAPHFAACEERGRAWRAY